MPLKQPDIDGWWVATRAELGGLRLPAEALLDLPLRLRNGTFRFGTDEGWTVIHLHTKPHALDIVPARGPHRGRIVPAIIKISGSSMRLCCDLSGKRRPQEFSAPVGTRHFLATYRRVALPTRPVEEPRSREAQVREFHRVI